MKQLLLLIIVAAGVSFGVARWTTIQAQRPTAVSIHNPAWLKRELNLTSEQSRAIETLETAFQKQLEAACATHCAARMALGDELAKSPVDPAKARACVEKMNAVQADTERSTLEHILKVRSMLDDQQARHFSTLIQQQVCNMPMGAN